MMESNGTLTRTSFTHLFAKRLLIPHDKASTLTEVILEEIYLSLCKNKDLKLSSFGTFLVHDKSTRMGRNPKTGQEAVITARKSISFRSSHLLREKVNRPVKC